jgi:CRP-like cAMP-binding protein
VSLLSPRAVFDQEPRQPSGNAIEILIGRYCHGYHPGGDKMLSSSGSSEYIRLMAVSSPDLKAFLVATPFFGGLSDASLDLLISMLVERSFNVGAAVVAEGEPGRSMYIVHSGELVVNKLGESGRVIRIAGLGPGDFFGEMTLIEMQNRSATIVAESPTVLYELTARNLYAYYKADIHAYVMVMQNINRELCRRLRRADNRIAELADASRE